MRYPYEQDIVEYFVKLSAAVSAELEPLAEEAQRDYRRARRLQYPENEKKHIDLLCQHAAAVFRTRSAKLLKLRSGSFEVFRSAIGLGGGEAELAFWYAHHLYQVAEGGRMLWLWHREIQADLWDRIREAEDLWYNPDLVPEGWEKFLGNGPSSADGSPDPASPDRQTAPWPETDRKAPAEFFKEYRAKCPMASYEQIAASIGISRDCLFRIKGETAWVSSGSYEAAAKSLAC